MVGRARSFRLSAFDPAFVNDRSLIQLTRRGGSRNRGLRVVCVTWWHQVSLGLSEWVKGCELGAAGGLAAIGWRLLKMNGDRLAGHTRSSRRGPIEQAIDFLRVRDRSSGLRLRFYRCFHPGKRRRDTSQIPRRLERDP